MTDIETIIEMHRYKRPAGSASELEFIDRFITPLGTKRDHYDNHWIIVGDDPTMMFSSHTDSVHKTAGMQKLHFDGKILKLHPKAMSSCLGADCAAGVWIMCEMIKARVPGLYVFHAEEETGGWGSLNFAKHNSVFFAASNYKAAIAFDRRGYDSIITHMHSVRTCSDAFAKSLALQLDGYKTDDGGSFTDTDNYRKIVPECTNISVGYSRAHSYDERLDVGHLIQVRDMMLRLDPSKLVIARDPSAPDEFKTYSGGYTPLYPAGTIGNLVWSRPKATSRVLESLMDYDEFKLLIDKAQAEITEESFKGSNYDDLDDFPAQKTTTLLKNNVGASSGANATKATIPSNAVSTRALTQYGQGMSGTGAGVTDLKHHRGFRNRAREKVR